MSKTKRSQQITKQNRTSKSRPTICSNTKLSVFTTYAIKLMETVNTQESNTLFIKKIKEIRQCIGIMSDDIKYEIKEIKIPLNKLNELMNDTWISDEFVFDNLDYEVNVSWNMNNLYFKTTFEKFGKIQKRLPIFIKMMNYIQSHQEETPITIYYVLSDLKKKLIGNTIISPHHINSGYTDLITNEIFIWREEEFEKVTFHELMHLFNKDHRSEKISLPVNIKGPKSFYESIADFKAIIYNIIYISLNTKIKIETIINDELFFIQNQAMTILNHLNRTNCTQKSPAYSYYILKQHIFNYFRSGSPELFNNIFYKDMYFNKLIKLIKNCKLKKHTNYIDFNSARMSLYELE